MWITGGGGLFIFLALGALMTIAMIDGGERWWKIIKVKKRGDIDVSEIRNYRNSI